MFYENDDLNNKLNCLKCNQRLDEPRTLSCGEFICSYCCTSVKLNESKFKCFVCNEYHLMPEKGFYLSVEGLKKINKIEIGFKK